MTNLDRIESLREGLEQVVRTQLEADTQLTVLTDLDAEHEPLPIRKAKALRLLLREAPIYIYPGELIVGIPFREKPIYDSGKEGYLRGLPQESVSGKSYVEAAQRKIATGLSDEAYDPVIIGSQPSTGGSIYALFPHYATEKERAEAVRFGLDENSNPGHLQAGHARVVTLGWRGLRQEAEEKLARLDESTGIGKKRGVFLRSVIIALEGAQTFACRYADLARRMAEDEVDSKRRQELTEISGICFRIADAPPQTFWEALQIHWFTHLICHTQGARQLGRFDQYIYPFLESDLREGRLTVETARELLECLWIKYNMLTDVTMDNLQNMILGGLTRDGRDATNMLSYMCMEATDRLGLIDPKWSVRVHKGTPEGFLRKVCEIIKKGRYQPGIYNDEAIIKALVNIGIPLEDARDFTNDGCSEILVQGKSNPWCFEARVNLPKCLERAIASLEEYETFDDLMDALKREISVAVEMAVANANLLQSTVPLISPNPFVSATVEGCIERMIDLTEGGAVYNSAAVCASGASNTADALAGVKKLVFEEEKVEKRELINALKNNFDGLERLRLMLLNRAPKFGNDDDYVDSLAVEIVEHTSNEVRKHRNPRGGEYILGLFSYGEYIGHGFVTGATADGRRAGEGIAPNFSPSPGRDLKGPFAVLKSVSKVDPRLTANGTAVDIALHPTALSGTKGVEKLASLIKSFIDLDCMQVQFNIVDAETLKAAQKEPEKYRSLTVRLWGFPAYFVRLPKEFQDHIIARTGHRL